MKRILPWAWFAVVQLISLVATVLGWVLLVPFCLSHAWKLGPKSIKDERIIDVWSWASLNLVYGNPEDGVSGMFALVQGNQEYMPSSKVPAWWRAYCWSALRNSCDNLKYVFAWKGGPFWRREFGRFYVQAGWYPNGLPVLSAGSI